MKNKIPYFIVLLLGVMAVTFYACEDKEDYDFNAIEPIIFEMTGPTTVAAHGLPQFPFRYSVPHRGGSTFDWTVTGHGGSVVKDEKFPSIAYVTFNLANETTTATVNVTETTMGGKTATFSKNVTLNRFCLIPDEIQGLYGEDDDGWVVDVNITKDPNDPSGLILTGVLAQGWWWGPPGGKIKLTLDYCTGVVSLLKQPTGIIDSTYGMVYVEQAPGTTGTYDFDTGVITVTYRITVDAGSFGDWPFIYTPKF